MSEWEEEWNHWNGRNPSSFKILAARHSYVPEVGFSKEDISLLLPFYFQAVFKEKPVTIRVEKRSEPSNSYDSILFRILLSSLVAVWSSSCIWIFSVKHLEEWTSDVNCFVRAWACCQITTGFHFFHKIEVYGQSRFAFTVLLTPHGNSKPILGSFSYVSDKDYLCVRAQPEICFLGKVHIVLWAWINSCRHGWLMFLPHIAQIFQEWIY